MPDPTTSDRTQYAVLWVKHGDDANGEPVLDYPRQILVRWNWRRSSTMSPDNQVISLDAQMVADERIPIDSLVWLGRLPDEPGTGTDVFEPDSEHLCQVKTWSGAVDVKGEVERHEYGLRRFRNTLPTSIYSPPEES